MLLGYTTPSYQYTPHLPVYNLEKPEMQESVNDTLCRILGSEIQPQTSPPVS